MKKTPAVMESSRFGGRQKVNANSLVKESSVFLPPTSVFVFHFISLLFTMGRVMGKGIVQYFAPTVTYRISEKRGKKSF